MYCIILYLLYSTQYSNVRVLEFTVHVSVQYSTVQLNVNTVQYSPHTRTWQVIEYPSIMFKLVLALLGLAFCLLACIVEARVSLHATNILYTV